MHTYLKSKYATLQRYFVHTEKHSFHKSKYRVMSSKEKKMFFYSNFWPPNQANNNRRFARCSRFLVFWSRLSLITMRIRKIYLTMFDFVNVVSLNNSKYTFDCKIFKFICIIYSTDDEIKITKTKHLYCVYYPF